MVWLVFDRKISIPHLSNLPAGDLAAALPWLCRLEGGCGRQTPRYFKSTGEVGSKELNFKPTGYRFRVNWSINSYSPNTFYLLCCLNELTLLQHWMDDLSLIEFAQVLQKERRQSSSFLLHSFLSFLQRAVTEDFCRTINRKAYLKLEIHWYDNRLKWAHVDQLLNAFRPSGMDVM